MFRRRQQELEKLTPDQIELQRRELAELERKFLERVATTNRSKSAALPAAPAVAGESSAPVFVKIFLSFFICVCTSIVLL